jgi:hypothetical protein
MNTDYAIATAGPTEMITPKSLFYLATPNEVIVENIFGQPRDSAQ